MALNNYKKISLFFFLLIGQIIITAQPVRYWIKFRDKNGTAFSINQPEKFLSQTSIIRRVKSNVSIDISDLPVTQDYINGVAAVPNVKVVYASKWLNGIVIQFDNLALAAPALSLINALPFVLSNNQVQKYHLDYGAKLNNFNNPPYPAEQKNSNISEINSTSTYSYGGSGAQIRQLQVDCLHEKGFRGQGMTIAVLDVGFQFVDSNPIYDSLRARHGILGTRDFVDGGDNAYRGGTHGSMVLSCMAANKPGLICGTAPMANYWLLRTEQGATEYLTEEYNWIRGAEFADSVGADILTTSLGYTEFDDASENHTYATLNGRTAPMSIAANMAARKGMFVLNAAGNEGAAPWHFISVPGDADSICTVGAIDSAGALAAFSSVGPTADNRIKPDLVAVGVGSWISVDAPSAFPGNGTSFATPILAGAVACYWQANRQLNNIDVLREIKLNANNASNPNNQTGWGIPRLCLNEDIGLSVHVINNEIHRFIQVRFNQSDYSNNTFELVDLQGKVLYSTKMQKNDRKYIIQADDFSDAIYVARLRNKNGEHFAKFVLR